MGRDKAMLLDRGIPLAMRVASVVAAAVAGPCSIVAPAGRYEELDLPVIADRWPGEGPLGGILTALEDGAAEWSVIVAVDLPRLHSGFLIQLLTAARLAGRTTVPVHADGGLEPLCGVYHSGDLPALRDFFARGGRRVKDALREIHVLTIPADEDVLVNVNTPGQWEALRS